MTFGQIDFLKESLLLIFQTNFKEKHITQSIYSQFRSYLVLCRPYISQCIHVDLKWKAIMLISPNNSCAVCVTMVL